MSDATAPCMSTTRSGCELLADPQLNKGTAFSEAERDAFALHGLLPPHVSTLDEQLSRGLQALRQFDAAACRAGAKLRGVAAMGRTRGRHPGASGRPCA